MKINANEYSAAEVMKFVREWTELTQKQFAQSIGRSEAMIQKMCIRDRFFVDPVRRVVGTSHSGWKGTVAQIGAVTVERMCADYGCRRQDILAGIGPSIGPCCFEEMCIRDRASSPGPPVSAFCHQW